MSTRNPIGYVVEIDGAFLLINLLEQARGHVAGHRDGLSTVEQPGDLIGVEAGAEIIVVRVLKVAFAEPKEIHQGQYNRKNDQGDPLRQLKGCVIGYIKRIQETLVFVPQDWRLPVLGASAFPLSGDELATTIGNHGRPEESLSLGKDARNTLVSVSVNVNDLLSRHLAILGATGQGKTHFVAALLQKLVHAPKARIVIFDVNGEYTAAFSHLGNRLKRTVLGGVANELPAGVIGLRIPYYALGRHGLSRLLLPSEKTQMPALRFAIEHLRFIEADKNGARMTGHPDNVMFDDCRNASANDAYQQLEKIRAREVAVATKWPHMRGIGCLAAESYSIKKNNQGQIQRDPFAYGHIHSLVNRIRTFIDDGRFREVVDIEGGDPVVAPLSINAECINLVTNIFGKPAFEEGDWNVHIIDVSKLAQDLMPFVLGSLLELYASELFRRGSGKTHPTMLVLEEAHHYLRQLPGDAETGQHSLAYERLAKEGRKFGLSLMISTQRPSEVSTTVLAQCGTWAVFRLSNDTDQRAVAAAAESAGTNVTRQLSGLARGEAILFGAAMPIATRMSVIRPNPVPLSLDPPFIEKWEYSGVQTIEDLL